MTFEELRDLMVETLDIEADKITETSALQDDLDIDSLDAMELVMAIENEFGISIEDDKIGEIKTVEDILKFARG